jgi:hypothetical protein
VTTAATGFVEYAEGEPDKVAFFAQYGVTVGSTDEGDEALGSLAALFDDEAIAAAQENFASAASAVLPEEHVDTMSDAFADVMADIPEAAALTEEQMQQLIAEVAAEHL